VSKIAAVLRDEITRLARREVTAATKALRKSNAQYRRDIAALKRDTAKLEKKVQFLEKRERDRATTTPPATAAEGRRFSASGLRSHRNKLGLSAADYAALVGVSPQTVYNWERGVTRPQDAQLAAIVEVRGMGKREAMRQLELLSE